MPRPALKVRADGRYRCKYQGKYFYGSTSKEAYAARDAYIREIEGRDPEPEQILVGEYAPRWLKAHKAGVKPRTFNDYTRIINTLTADLGSLPMNDVTVTDIKQIYSDHYLGKSRSAINKAKMIYTAVWDTALEDGLVTRNPCRSAKASPHRGTYGTHRALSVEEDDLILQVPHKLRLAVLVMRYAGLRRGEVLALDIDRDVDFDNHVIHVREAVRYDSNQAILSTTKTEAGVRDVPMFSILESELKDHHGLVAPDASGDHMTHAAFNHYWHSWKAAIETEMNGDTRRWYGKRKGQDQGKMPEWKPCTIRCHDLRHSFCTMLRDSGVDIKLAIRWMGHADEKMVLKVYDHITDKRIKTAIQNVENSLQGVKTGVKSTPIPENPHQDTPAENGVVAS